MTGKILQIVTIYYSKWNFYIINCEKIIKVKILGNSDSNFFVLTTKMFSFLSQVMLLVNLLGCCKTVQIIKKFFLILKRKMILNGNFSKITKSINLFLFVKLLVWTIAKAMSDWFLLSDLFNGFTIIIWEKQ